MMAMVVGCGPTIITEPSGKTARASRDPAKAAARSSSRPKACVTQGEQLASIVNASARDGRVRFCIASGSETNPCYSARLSTGKYLRLSKPPLAQSPTIVPSLTRVETTTTEVKVCKGGDCAVLAPKVGKNENQLLAAANDTHVVIMLGDAESGKGYAEVWELGASKKVATIKYGGDDFNCGVPRMLGDTVFISASVCAGPSARGALYNLKGKKIADAGGEEFGTYNEVAVQIEGTTWGFLEENGAMVAIQDVTTGEVKKTISLGTLWETKGQTDGATSQAMGNPGETSMVRGDNGTLIVISGSPTPGNIAEISVTSGNLAVTHAPICSP
jgi:hypothetical protein